MWTHIDGFLSPCWVSAPLERNKKSVHRPAHIVLYFWSCRHVWRRNSIWDWICEYDTAAFFCISTSKRGGRWHHPHVWTLIWRRTGELFSLKPSQIRSGRLFSPVTHSQTEFQNKSPCGWLRWLSELRPPSLPQLVVLLYSSLFLYIPRLQTNSWYFTQSDLTVDSLCGDHRRWADISCSRVRSVIIKS